LFFEHEPQDKAAAKPLFRLCLRVGKLYSGDNSQGLSVSRHAYQGAAPLGKKDGPRYTPDQAECLRQIHERLIEARRELDALIGDAYLRPRASIVPVHFLDLASAVEKLRWAEKEWRELDRELAEEGDEPATRGLVEAVAAEAKQA
jgi:hypothetical protein